MTRGTTLSQGDQEDTRITLSYNYPVDTVSTMIKETATL